ncbi:probable serine incorporator isoform X1 [Ricinus communis]|uniref:probable serine incorporator isoform X1 n=2 Tax=Ricinus communis TaxID=3988 RepID=UPI00201B28A0|nr:probable serine incorporator isoform X1 [Ricinus communis]
MFRYIVNMDQHAQSIKERAVDIRQSHSEAPQEVLPGQLEANSSNHSQEKKKPLRARFVYGIIFLITNLKAWFFRDYGQKVLSQFNYIKACGVDGLDCCHTLGVLRVSLGCFIFFFVMFATTIKARKLYEARNTWHSGWWTLKLFLLILSMAVPFFFPSNYIQVYGELARIGAGIFLVLQLVSVIEFIGWWNNYWMPDKEMRQSCSFGLFMSTIFYIASVCGIGVMYYFYGQSLKCSLNIFFISWTAVLLIVMMAISLHSKVNRGLLSTGIMASYLVFLCWSAIRSEPVDKRCNKQNQENGNSDWTTILSFLIAICAIVMATFSTGIDSQSFQFRKDKVQEEDDIPYDYGFFHMVFALGAMYFAMLFISWNLNNSARKWSIDVGFASTWVKIVSEWFAATIYLWKLISPVVRQPKVMNLEGNQCS